MISLLIEPRPLCVNASQPPPAKRRTATLLHRLVPSSKGVLPSQPIHRLHRQYLEDLVAGHDEVVGKIGDGRKAATI
jgi:hypothetical protein